MSKEFWKKMTPLQRLFYKAMFKRMYRDLPIYSYDFWFFIANEHTTVRSWFLEFDETLPEKLPMKWLEFG